VTAAEDARVATAAAVDAAARACGRRDWETAMAAVGAAIEGLAATAGMVGSATAADTGQWGVLSDVARQVADDLTAAAVGLTVPEVDMAAALEEIESTAAPVVRVRMPGSGVVVSYASARELDQSRRLARARVQLARDGVHSPDWGELADAEREDATLEARNWLRAGARIGWPGPAGEGQ
jgi:hypothetical protein